uniref:Uncharacterized protein n=1 Tax=Timema cristinae TaxID=61476 RepID=A0A7R9GTW6_TIMCR|nr:unnamed protein product [Timema cristinae]
MFAPIFTRGQTARLKENGVYPQVYHSQISTASLGAYILHKENKGTRVVKYFRNKHLPAAWYKDDKESELFLALLEHLGGVVSASTELSGLFLLLEVLSVGFCLGTRPRLVDLAGKLPSDEFVTNMFLCLGISDVTTDCSILMASLLLRLVGVGRSELSSEITATRRVRVALLGDVSSISSALWRSVKYLVRGARFRIALTLLVLEKEEFEKDETNTSVGTVGVFTASKLNEVTLASNELTEKFSDGMELKLCWLPSPSSVDEICISEESAKMRLLLLLLLEFAADKGEAIFLSEIRGVLKSPKSNDEFDNDSSFTRPSVGYSLSLACTMRDDLADFHKGIFPGCTLGDCNSDKDFLVLFTTPDTFPEIQDLLDDLIDFLIGFSADGLFTSDSSPKDWDVKDDVLDLSKLVVGEFSSSLGVFAGETLECPVSEVNILDVREDFVGLRINEVSWSSKNIASKVCKSELDALIRTGVLCLHSTLLSERVLCTISWESNSTILRPELEALDSSYNGALGDCNPTSFNLSTLLVFNAECGGTGILETLPVIKVFLVIDLGANLLVFNFLRRDILPSGLPCLLDDTCLNLTSDRGVLAFNSDLLVLETADKAFITEEPFFFPVELFITKAEVSNISFGDGTIVTIERWEFTPDSDETGEVDASSFLAGVRVEEPFFVVDKCGILDGVVLTTENCDVLEPEFLLLPFEDTANSFFLELALGDTVGELSFGVNTDETLNGLALVIGDGVMPFEIRDVLADGVFFTIFEDTTDNLFFCLAGAKILEELSSGVNKCDFLNTDVLETESVHPTEIQTSISPSSAVELNTTSALANYAEAVMGKTPKKSHELERDRPYRNAKPRKSISRQGHTPTTHVCRHNKVISAVIVDCITLQFSPVWRFWFPSLLISLCFHILLTLSWPKCLKALAVVVPSLNTQKRSSHFGTF